MDTANVLFAEASRDGDWVPVTRVDNAADGLAARLVAALGRLPAGADGVPSWVRVQMRTVGKRQVLDRLEIAPAGYLGTRPDVLVEWLDGVLDVGSRPREVVLQARRPGTVRTSMPL